MKKIFFSKVILVIEFCSFFYSCSDEITKENDKIKTIEVSEIEVKQKFQTFNKKGKKALIKMRKGFINNDKTTLSEQQAQAMFNELYDDAYQSLLFMGVEKDSLATYSKEDIVFTSFILGGLYGKMEISESNNNNVALRSSAGDIAHNIIDCIGYATFGVSVLNGVVNWGEALGYQTALRLLGRSATRALGIVGAALIIYDFVDCMTSVSSDYAEWDGILPDDEAVEEFEE